jgi:hypothetical protein
MVGYHLVRMPSALEARVSQHDREIAAIRKLVLTGMKLLVRLEASQKRLDVSLTKLEASQKETDRMLKDLIRSLGRGGGNGHTKADLR